MTRRELRERRRAQEEGERAGSQSTPIHIPVMALGAPLRPLPLISTTHTIQHTHHRKRRISRKGLGLSAMLFVGAMAVATSVPANAVYSTSQHAGAKLTHGVAASDTAASSSAASGAAVSAAPKSATDQTLTSNGAALGKIERDGITVTSREQVAELSHLHTANTFTNDPNGTIQWPFMVGVPIAAYFGPRVAPIEGASTFHEGVDFDPGYGAPIQSIADGVVRLVDPRNDNALGVHIIIDHMIHGKLVSSLYGHMKPGSLRVTQGEKVTVGQIIGEVGDTGISTGAHLHFEILLNGTEPVDPYAWLKANAN